MYTGINILGEPWSTSRMDFLDKAESLLKTTPAVRPIEATSLDNDEKVENFVLEDARVKNKQLSALAVMSENQKKKNLIDSRT